MPSARPAYHRRNDLKRLQEHAKDLPLTVQDNGHAYEVYAASTSDTAPRVIAGRHEVVWAFIQGWRGAQQRSLGTSDWLDTAVEAEDSACDLASRMLDMLERVEWVRATGGKHDVCPFCHAVGERDDGPGHQDDCEWMQVTRAGNELRLAKVLR